MNPFLETQLLLSRRHFFSLASWGVGTAALTSLLNKDLVAGTGLSAELESSSVKGGLPELPHFAPKAKRVIYLFQSGAPAQMDLFDYKPSKKELPGGNAKSFNWSLLRGIKIEKPWFLSGGININNINDIKNYAIPYGIDVSSGVEEKLGIKNNKKIVSLVNAYGSK